MPAVIGSFLSLILALKHIISFLSQTDTGSYNASLYKVKLESVSFIMCVLSWNNMIVNATNCIA